MMKLQHSTLMMCLALGSIFAQKPEDIKAIESICGCYEVTFRSAETFSHPKDSAYKPSETKYDKALELIIPIETSPKKMVLQHLLIINDSETGKDHIIKHWRQDWAFENTHVMSYNGFNDWKLVDLPKSQVKNQWTQSVYQVDDSPRYAGSATWVHIDGRHFWESTDNAPLPRREETVRKDYNILKRTNTNEIKPWGWVHDQDNDKIMRSIGGEEYLLAQEKGCNTYTKVPNSRCLLAENWWKENQALWSKVRKKWDLELYKRHYIKLKDKVDGKAFYEHLSDLDQSSTQKMVDGIIDRFIEKD